jgi:hypothetical protein
VDETGLYDLQIRYAALYQQGIAQLQMIKNESTQSLGWFTIPTTGGWQTWNTLNDEVQLTKGTYTLRMTVLQPGFNINWFKFNYSDQNLGLEDNTQLEADLEIFPNPVNDELYINFEANPIDAVALFDMNGREIYSRAYVESPFSVQLQLPVIESGLYVVRIASKNRIFYKKLYKK